ncbi:HAD family hydrolase [Porphyrobacter sp. ULC335]|uniref:HAD family hydrolase n=1 Tax=Porphyrobacter sp. ULC335 TaxID=2854260 RepID=UPI00221F40A7|nr:HAD-IB family phosphatase [Porphyrobacter sp. ULC335]UYV15216.1 HAD-IB family phosphatase [Porphyrobacter sp. ULC335]
MQRIALYDLDRTVTRAPTFTPFLVHMAATGNPLRLLGVPLWVLAMAGYKAKLYGRKPLKQFGLRLLVGKVVRSSALQPRIDRFVARQIERNIQPGARAQIAADRAAGVRLVLVTAAPEIYAEALAVALGFEACIATRHQRTGDGSLLALIDGENNYGSQKVARVEAWLAEQGLARQDVHLAAYTDHASDAPILNLADAGVLVGRYAEPQGGWAQVDWSAAAA